MANLENSKVPAKGPFSGKFRIRQPHRRETRDGRPFLQLALEDLAGRIPAYVWQTASRQEFPVDLSCMQVDGVIRFRRDGAVADVRRLSLAEKSVEDALRLIPQSICPLPWALSFLESVVLGIQTPQLRRFVLEVLANDSIAFPFVACPASLRYHHNYPGGLLRHSIECAQENPDHDTPDATDNTGLDGGS